MKRFFCIFLTLILCTSFFTPKAEAASQAVSARVLLSGTNITASAWYTLVASTARAIKGITVFSTSQNPFQLAVGASGSESVQLTLPAGKFVNEAKGASLFYPLSISQGAKVALRALDSTMDAGEVQVNLFYY